MVETGPPLEREMSQLDSAKRLVRKLCRKPRNRVTNKIIGVAPGTAPGICQASCRQAARFARHRHRGHRSPRPPPSACPPRGQPRVEWLRASFSSEKTFATMPAKRGARLRYIGCWAREPAVSDSISEFLSFPHMLTFSLSPRHRYTGCESIFRALSFDFSFVCATIFRGKFPFVWIASEIRYGVDIIVLSRKCKRRNLRGIIQLLRYQGFSSKFTFH